MIYGHIEHICKYTGMLDKLDEALVVLSETDLSTLTYNGEAIHMGREGDILFIPQVCETKTDTEDEQEFEHHKKYIDIQVMVEANEFMGIGVLEDNSYCIRPYSKEKDAGFVLPRHPVYMNFRKDHFFIFFPEDAHAPSLRYLFNEDGEIIDGTLAKVKKLIVKVPI